MLYVRLYDKIVEMKLYAIQKGNLRIFDSGDGTQQCSYYSVFLPKVLGPIHAQVACSHNISTLADVCRCRSSPCEGSVYNC